MADTTTSRPESRGIKNPVGEPEVTKVPNVIPDDSQDGVRIAEAVALSWSKTSAIVVYICNSMWLLYFSRAMIGSLSETLTPFVTSGFESHSLMTVMCLSLIWMMMLENVKLKTLDQVKGMVS